MALVAASLLAVTPLAAETHFQFSLLFEFALGILLAIAFEKGFLQPRPWLGIMMMLAGLLISSQLEMGFESDLRGFINALPAMAIFLGTLWLGSEWKKLPLFSHLGNSSYSLYLFHPFVLGVVPLLARWLSLHAILPLATVIAASCIAAIVISHIVYLYVERPLTERLRKAVL
jgi:peptidoglycan/LPS O-acetylase OafA/YrhL